MSDINARSFSRLRCQHTRRYELWPNLKTNKLINVATLFTRLGSIEIYPAFVMSEYDSQLRYLSSGMSLNAGCCLDIIHRVLADNPAKKRKALDKLRAETAEYARQEVVYKDKLAAVKAASDAAGTAAGERNFDLDVISRSFEEFLETNGHVVTDVDVAKHPMVQRLESRIAELEGVRGQRDDADPEDDDIVTSHVDLSQLDPISKTRITDPVRNVTCGHVYDRKVILEYLRKHPKTLCPLAGCANKTPLDDDQLERDGGVRRRLRKARLEEEQD